MTESPHLVRKAGYVPLQGWDGDLGRSREESQLKPRPSDCRAGAAALVRPAGPGTLTFDQS